MTILSVSLRTGFGGGSLPVAYLPGGSKVLASHLPPPRVRLKARPRPAGMHKSALLLTRPAGVIWRSYYYANTAHIAMREDSDEGSEVYYILTDHLGSTSITYRTSDGLTSRQWYKPWGEIRQVSGVMPTDYSYTGQRQAYALGMLWYNSRFYDPYLNRWVQPDSIIPDYYDPQSFDHHAYVRNNPINRIDPSGHLDLCPECGDGGDLTDEERLRLLRLERANALGENGWDLVPVVSDVRCIIRGSQVASWASQQPGFADQQTELLDWQNNCYGQCHYADTTDLGPSYPSIGGPMPNVPLVDIYSSGVGETTSGVTNLLMTATVVKSQTQVFSNTGVEWHLGLETKNKMSIIHVGNSAKFGTYIAFGSVAPKVAYFHIYFQKAFPFFRFWTP